MQNIEKLNVLNEACPGTANSTFQKVKQIESMYAESGFTLINKFLKELQLSTDNFLRMHDGEA